MPCAVKATEEYSAAPCLADPIYGIQNRAILNTAISRTRRNEIVESVPQAQKAFYSGLNILAFRTGAALNNSATWVGSLLQVQKLSDLGQRKPELFGARDKFQLAKCLAPIVPRALYRTGRLID